ncbi:MULTISPECIES: DUF4124 domain-containing protein [unclassified Polaromonas]|jgi:hypothetical protein|uniref:DUF4124 domain-containing protein n=1 Tax=unclassified Polaromonas TaxID=2638319 RepID=UPI000BD0A1FD|nr:MULTISPECIES: DUF4124 domain-containing protein [unclassified Polaromonas]OYY37454.1 MAG: DUF4124 domain-containing protein [Polaromonas sp. 35-63-35]OYZ21524.1 MAG: DUF4124 domain-containing protein [Polaromonas sp. 16-63-31]OYZ77665.1 MAG: DUF4124 domain-containing protein [Polaromonas sp. 24-63-21]OZA50006.1 MAG: DUF4124 domain-containing protein [Polaromonas sp. 17-63-33]OZA87004.1 MAG: DUF4124 domain-containing protein [Polaromonas sp. 39-63-25]
MELKITPKHLLLLLAGWTFALSAAAQWQWIGKDGRKVFSDRPPPTDIQDKDILKQPGGRGRAKAPVAATEPTEGTPSAAAATAAPAAKAAKTNTPKISGKDAELEAKKKKLEEEEAAKKKADDEKVAKARADNCERTKKAMVTIQSGARISTTNTKGEREIMDDSGRAAESKRLQAIIDSDCK